jgi:hypothetical protein
MSTKRVTIITDGDRTMYEFPDAPDRRTRELLTERGFTPVLRWRRATETKSDAELRSLTTEEAATQAYMEKHGGPR